MSACQKSVAWLGSVTLPRPHRRSRPLLPLCMPRQISHCGDQCKLGGQYYFSKRRNDEICLSETRWKKNEPQFERFRCSDASDPGFKFVLFALEEDLISWWCTYVRQGRKELDNELNPCKRPRKFIYFCNCELTYIHVCTYVRKMSLQCITSCVI
jgi:hypothetical protein